MSYVCFFFSFQTDLQVDVPTNGPVTLVMKLPTYTFSSCKLYDSVINVVMPSSSAASDASKEVTDTTSCAASGVSAIPAGSYGIAVESKLDFTFNEQAITMSVCVLRFLIGRCLQGTVCIKYCFCCRCCLCDL